MSSVRIGIADDHEMIRKGLRQLIDGEEGMEVVGEAANGREAVKLALSAAPEVMLMDVVMPGCNGIEATREIKKQSPGIQVIALSMHNDCSYIIEMLKSGASGYLLKESALDELVAAVRTVLEKHVHVGKSLANMIYEDFQPVLKQKKEGAGHVLAPLELQMLEDMRQGLSPDEIMTTRSLSEKEFEAAVVQILNKWLLLEKMRFF